MPILPTSIITSWLSVLEFVQIESEQRVHVSGPWPMVMAVRFPPVVLCNNSLFFLTALWYSILSMVPLVLLMMGIWGVGTVFVVTLKQIILEARRMQRQVCVCVCVCVGGGCLVIAMELSVTPASFFQPGCRAPTPLQPPACHLAVVGAEMPCAMNEANPTSSWMRHLVLPAPLWTAASWTALLLTTQWISCGLLWAQG